MLLKPKIKLDRVTDITVEMLKKRNIQGLILDVDNTLSTHHGQTLTEGLPEWLAYMRENGIKLTVLSNSNTKRLTPFAAKIGLDFIAMGLKPLPFGFFRAVKALGLPKKQVATVGDQIFTDTLGGNIAGVTTILLTPILPETSLRFRFKRWLERGVYRLYHIEKTEE
ncbi:MAG: YqeG family HAD IIIA-type phosphatase [Clostridia bacterium]|nr:YqeG family HAD IIIA-type phosphatase [Clostridia bacterium]